MRVAITGSSGVIGTALRSSLATDGHDVLRLVRRPAESAGEIQWDPAAGWLDPARLEGVEAVVNLAGAGTGDHRWTRSYKQTIRHSRISATTTLVRALAQLSERPRVLVSQSWIHVYGDGHGSDVIDEDEPPGEGGLLASVALDWEAAAVPAAEADIAVCYTRTGIVMTRLGGVLAEMLPLFRLGLGGPLAGGEQYWSYVSLPDTVAAMRFLMETHGCSGPYNLTGPEPVTNAEFTRVLAKAMGRPAILPVPEFALRIGLGMSAERAVDSLRVVPARLVEAGFEHQHPNAPSVVGAALR
ncbi:MAG TPA: TIGR01777 family oxidoreductase [Jiangellaceae bacterium]|nr:TIGR01777 family oxidoreductase [Jiangellaceae bacterium]